LLEAISDIKKIYLFFFFKLV